MSRNLLIDNIEAGMVLAESLTNNFGQVLMPAGTVIKSNHIKILKAWNIRTICVKQEGNEEEIVLNKRLIEIAQNNLSKRMNWIPSNPQERQLYRIGVFQAALRLSEKKEDAS